MTTLSFVDLFAGCGGLSYGFSFNPRFTGILASDFWDKAAETYRFNHKHVNFELKDLYIQSHVQDVIQIASRHCDVLIGGPPCQGFSTLGKRYPNCKKSYLVDIFIEIANKIKPKIILLENVKGFVSKKHPTGLTYKQYLEQNLEHGVPGYAVHSSLLDFSNFNIAQTRVRYICIGIRKDIYKYDQILQNIVNNINDSKSNQTPTLRDVISDLPLVSPRGGGQEIASNNNQSEVIFNHQSLNHSDELIARFAHVPPGGGLLDVPRPLLTDHLRRMVDGEYGSGGHVKNIYGRLEWDKPCGTIVAGMDKITCGRYLHPEQNRLLTPRECARIQTFPDNFRFFGGLVAQYYLIGNSVPPTMSKVFANSIAKAIDSTKS